MKITENEIKSITEIGTLDGKPVKLILTKGGLNICIGSVKGKKDEALTAASHQAIAKYNLEKQYPGFQPSLQKSESQMESEVENHSKYLSENLTKSGHDIYSVKNGPSIEFYVTKHNSQICKIDSNIENDTLIVNKMNLSKNFSHALAHAATEKALNCGISKIKVQK